MTPANLLKQRMPNQTPADKNIYPGEDRAWKALMSADAREICANAQADFDDTSGLYTVSSFGADYFVSPAKRTITSSTVSGARLLQLPDCFFRLSMLWYMTGARNIPLKNYLVRPEHIKGGQIFIRGTHVLPLGEIAEIYASDRDAFMKRGLSYGGSPESYGDSAFRLLPFPRIPVFMTLWLKDEEFPARADLFFDASCQQQAPTDVLWSIAMLCVRLML